MRVLEAVDLGDRDDVYFGLRALFASRRDDIAIFDELFNSWWRIQPAAGASPAEPPREQRNPAVRSPADEPRSAPASDFLTRWASPNAAVSDDDTLSLAAPSTSAALHRKNFQAYANDDLGAIERAAANIARRLRSRPSRRWKPSRRGRRIDFRRLLRLSLKTGGDVAELAHRQRKLRRTKLVVLCDVSGSMDLYSRFLLQFLFALQRAFARVETFAFSTRLARITDALRRESYREALDALESTPGWSGGNEDR